jgi:general secretion pathway protein I
MSSRRRDAAADRAGPVSRQRGFSLVEAVVALTLIATLGATLFAWVASSLNSLGRVEERAAEDAARLNILAYMNTVNPMLRPDGRADFGDLQIEWQAKPKLPPQDQIGYPAGIGLYQVGLYETRIVAHRPGESATWFELVLQHVGWRKLRELKLPF